MEDAAFLLGKVALKPEETLEHSPSQAPPIYLFIRAVQDTLHALGCSDGKEVVVRAVGTSLLFVEGQLTQSRNFAGAARRSGGQGRAVLGDGLRRPNIRKFPMGSHGKSSQEIWEPCQSTSFCVWMSNGRLPCICAGAQRRHAYRRGVSPVRLLRREAFVMRVMALSTRAFRKQIMRLRQLRQLSRCFRTLPLAAREHFAHHEGLADLVACDKIIDGKEPAP